MEISPANEATIGSYDALTDEFLASLDPDGGFSRRHLLNPAIFRMLGDVSGTTVLDAGCGQGYLCRLLAERGADVVGVEPARRLLDHAERLEAERRQGVRYLQRDLSRLGDIGAFDAVVANMVLLDIADWRTALANCVHVLRTGGRLVYSLHHPCWVPGRFEEWAQKGHVEIAEYLHEYVVAGPAGVNFQRPLSEYVNATIALGCDIFEMAEPALDERDAETETQKLFAHVPNFVVVGAIKR